MRRIDEVKRKKMKNVRFIEIIDKKRMRIVFANDSEITLKVFTEYYGYDCGIYIEKDNI
jgi:hypothetical protein